MSDTALAERHGGGIAEIQRNRLLIAAAQAARERGAAAVSVSDIVTRAGVSRRTFYEIFADRKECLQATLEEALARAATRVLPAWQAQDQWRGAVGGALRGFLVFLDEQPALATFLLLDSLGAGDWALARRAEAIDVLVDAVDAGRRFARSPASLSRVTAEGVVGAVLAILHARLREAVASGALAGNAGSMTDLLGHLTSIVLMPYLGPGAACRQAARNHPQPSRQAAAPAGDELRDLEIRLTYRTARVLRSISVLCEGAVAPSNRGVAAHAGIADPGQVSKLLSRLARAGLIENTGGSRERGEPNAWRLTAKGAKIERTIRGG
ncbi:MAG TPA: TetR/AcrR family transcriptional regulator [Solirubrobacteraceae bacterium]|jgi:AcrR family transcriptional regulator